MFSFFQPLILSLFRSLNLVMRWVLTCNGSDRSWLEAFTCHRSITKASPQAQDGVKYKDGHLEGQGVIL